MGLSTDSFKKDDMLLSMVLCYIEMDSMRNKLIKKEEELEELRRSSLSLYKYD